MHFCAFYFSSGTDRPSGVDQVSKVNVLILTCWITLQCLPILSLLPTYSEMCVVPFSPFFAPQAENITIVCLTRVWQPFFPLFFDKTFEFAIQTCLTRDRHFYLGISICFLLVIGLGQIFWFERSAKFLTNRSSFSEFQPPTHSDFPVLFFPLNWRLCGVCSLYDFT